MPVRRRSLSRRPTRRELLTVGATAPWDRAAEGVPIYLCRICGGYLGPITPGSEAVCLSCLHTGRDRELAYERTLSLARPDREAPAFRPNVPAEPDSDPEPIVVPPLIVRFEPRARPERAPA